LHQVSDLFELNVKLRCQKIKGVEECLDRASNCKFDIDDFNVKLVVLNSLWCPSENILGHFDLRIWN